MQSSLVIECKKVTKDQITTKNGYKFVRTRDCGSIRKVLRSNLLSIVYTEKEYAVIFGDDAWLFLINNKDPFMHPDLIYNTIDKAIDQLVDELKEHQIVSSKNALLSKGSFMNKVKGLFNYAMEYDQPPLPIPREERAKEDGESMVEESKAIENTEELFDVTEAKEISADNALDYLGALEDEALSDTHQSMEGNS